MNRAEAVGNRRPRWLVYLLLGRISNLPTVWTNCLAGVILAGGNIDGRIFFLLAALSFFYAGGMFLNDAFDHHFDRRFRPQRPIPSGDIGRGQVYSIGIGLLILGEFTLALPALLQQNLPEGEVMIGGLLLASLIIYYNYRHKSDPLSPLVMALCRAMTYLIAAATVASALSKEVLFGAGVLAAYLIGLTYVAKQENLQEVKNLWPLIFLFTPAIFAWPLLQPLGAKSVFYFIWSSWVLYAISFLLRKGGRNIPRAVVFLIAGISLVDGMLIATVPGQSVWGWEALLGFLLTLSFQRYIPGT